MAAIRVTCKNEEEWTKVLEIAEKEGYAWSAGPDVAKYRPRRGYPYDIVFCKNLVLDILDENEKSYTAQDFIVDHAEPFGISKKVKNEIILDFMEKWHDVLEECRRKECENCVLYDGECKAELMEYSGNKNAFMDAAKFMIKAMEEK